MSMNPKTSRGSPPAQDRSSGSREAAHADRRNTTLVLNGDIQNRQEPRWELEQALYTFNCRSGTEVVLRVFRAWDVKSLGEKQRDYSPRSKD
jgi:asparagine synthetase B (glutamine-hydrolysing)